MIFCPHVEIEEQVAFVHALKLPQRASVLEAGCGTAPLLRRLATEFPTWKTIGIDLHVGALAEACMLAANDRRGIDFLQIDLYQLPYADGTFDLVYTRDLWPYLADPQCALQELQRVLKPEGQLILFENTSVT